MKANELIVGCWVTSKKWREKPFKITRINDSGKYYYGITAEGSQVGPFLIEELEPIPVTAEILEKNGFIGIMGGNGIEYTSEEFNLRVIYRINNEGWTIYANHFGFDKKDLYVHELQHALRLCGIEKKIVL